MPYKAMIELLIDVPDYGGACDAVAETMREHMRKFSPSSCFIDWRYVIKDDEPGPVEVGPIPDDFTEDSNWPVETQ